MGEFAGGAGDRRMFLVAAGAAAVGLPAALSVAGLSRSEATDYHAAMESVGRAMREFREAGRDLRSPEGQSAAATAANAMAVGLVTAIGLADQQEIPPKALGRFGDDKRAFVREMRKLLVRTAMAALDLELSCLEGDADAIREKFAEVRRLNSQGHNAFKAD